MANQPETTRTFQFVPEAEERLQRMMDKINAMSAGEVVREALQFYEWVIDEREAGNRVGSLDKTGRFTVVRFTDA